MTKSWKKARRQAYMSFTDGNFREAIYALAKSLQEQGMTIPQAMQNYINHVEKVRSQIEKPK